MRVAGADPGTSSLDLVILDDGVVSDQQRFAPEELDRDADAPVRWLAERGPFALVAGPSGYGLPLVAARDCGERERALMLLVRPDERRQARGVVGLSGVLRALCASDLPVVFLPGVIHLPTVPAWRKTNRIDLGTPDKLCVAALALAERAERTSQPLENAHFCVVELGSVFASCLLVTGGQITAGLGGTSGPPGWGSGGAWDGETAYLFGPLAKRDLFAGGASTLPPGDALRCLGEGLEQAVAGLMMLGRCDDIVLSGRLLETQPEATREVETRLGRLAPVRRLPALPGAWVKHAAQGAAIVADGLAGGRFASLIERLALRQASGSVLDALAHPRAEEIRRDFLGNFTV
jgi:predicted butyrate kinase (DUF1464 family)